MSISVLLADDNLLIREGVKALIDLSEDIEVIGEAAEYDELVDAADENHVLIVDDQDAFRSAARLVVELTDGFEVAAEATTGEEGLSLVESRRYRVQWKRAGPWPTVGPVQA